VTGDQRPGENVSARWARWRAAIDLDDYDARWQKMLDAGEAAHGEADFVDALAAAMEPGPILDAGCGTGRVAIELARRGYDVAGVDLDPDMIAAAAKKAPSLAWRTADLATFTWHQPFAVVVMAGNVLLFARPQDRDAIVRNLAAQLRGGGLLVAGFSLEEGGYRLEEYDASCAEAGLTLVDRFATWERDPYAGGTYHVSVHARPNGEATDGRMGS
jgi:SAM-dependent methyltransferase